MDICQWWTHSCWWLSLWNKISVLFCPFVQRLCLFVCLFLLLNSIVVVVLLFATALLFLLDSSFSDFSLPVPSRLSLPLPPDMLLCCLLETVHILAETITLFAPALWLSSLPSRAIYLWGYELSKPRLHEFQTMYNRNLLTWVLWHLRSDHFQITELSG